MASLFPATSPAEPDQHAVINAEVPTLEFLEFLAEWETDQDEWAGPEQFEDNSFDQLYDDSNEIEDDE